MTDLGCGLGNLVGLTMGVFWCGPVRTYSPVNSPGFIVLLVCGSRAVVASASIYIYIVARPVPPSPDI